MGACAKVGLVLLLFGGILVIVGMATSSWMAVKEINAHIGLWKVCADKVCLSDSGDDTPDFLLATRAMVILSVVFVAVAIGLDLMAIMRDEVRGWKIAAMLTAFLAGVFAFAGVGIFGAKYIDSLNAQERELVKLSWSLILTAIGGGIDVLAGVFMACGLA